MRELCGSRGVLRERDDGSVVLEVVLSRAAAAEAFALALGSPIRISIEQSAPAAAIEAPAPPTAPTQTISTDGTESLVLGHNSPLRPADMQRMRQIQQLLQTSTFQSFAWKRSGLDELPPDAVEHAGQWLFKACGAESPGDLIAGPAAERADKIIAEFKATVA